MEKFFLHLASFSGNVGDIANHTAMHESFIKNSEEKTIIFSEIEIRKFYKNSNVKKFDNNFIKEINNYDALIIGGGNYFDVRWNNSYSGTTLDMSDSFMSKIEIPVLLNVIGYMNYYPQEKYKKSEKKFYEFLDKAISLNWTITVRNDGSKKRIISNYGNKFDNFIKSVPDAAFLFNKKKLLKERNKIIGINFINELFDLNYTNGYAIESFNKDAITFVNFLLHENFAIIFFPHTPHDLKILELFRNSIEENYFRYSIQIAPFCPNSLDGVLDIDKYYSKCDIVVGMRFHSCVLSLKNNVPVIALDANERLTDFFEEIGFSENCVSVKENCFTRIKNKIDYINNNYTQIQSKLNAMNKKISINYNEYVKSSLKYLGVNK